MDHIVLISKDVLSVRYLPTYGNTYWKTPNIDALAAKGTVFRRHYTAAPSTAMAFTSMFTGKHPLETARKNYTEVKQFDIDGGTTLFDEMHRKGYSCHLLWSDNYVYMAERFSRCYGEHTVHHNKLKLNQYVGAHMPGGLSKLTRDDDTANRTVDEILAEIDTIDRTKPVFLWVHLPHVIKGRTGYGDDIDLLDRFVGEIRERFGDNIFITADHGSNDGKDGKTGYGFDLYESSIHIPLVAPRLDGREEVTSLTSNADLMDMILSFTVPSHDHIFSDTAYYEQPHRKIAILKGNYKFVYDKARKRKSLYDVVYDPNENMDLNVSIIKDTDRHRNIVAEQVLYYPYRDEAQKAFEDLDEIFNSVWVNGSWAANFKNKQINRLKYFVGYWKAVFKKLKGKRK